MALFYVERQPWRHWPKKLVVVRKVDGAEKDERRWYVPERTCEVVGVVEWHDKYDAHFDFDLSCGHVVTTDGFPPNYCEKCGARVIDA